MGTRCFRSILFLFVAGIVASCGRYRGASGSEVIADDFSDPEVYAALANRHAIGAPMDDQRKETLGIGIVDVVIGRAAKSNKVLARNCVGTLIEDGDVATAAHCLPAEVREGASCNGVVFKHVALKEFYPCDKVLWHSSKYTVADDGKPDIDAFAPDVVVFSLRKVPTGLVRLKLPESPLRKGVNYRAWTYLTKHLANKVVEFQFAEPEICQIAREDVARDGFPFRALGCKVVQSNSGSPIGADDKHIQAVVSTDLQNKKDGTMIGTLVTDLACLHKANGNYFWDSACDELAPVRLEESPARDALSKK